MPTVFGEHCEQFGSHIAMHFLVLLNLVLADLHLKTDSVHWINPD